MSELHIFWDNSNIFIPAKYVANRREGADAERDIRIHFGNLYDVARAGRDVTSAVCVGSVPPELRAVWDNIRDTGVTVELYERGEGSGKEQGVDQCLQVHMLRALSDYNLPATAVLLTGDGAGYVDGTGFWADLKRMADKGWGIEVVAWDMACANGLRDWAKEVGVYIPLEEHYESVTFVKGLRDQKAVSLKHRPVVDTN